MNSTGGEWSKKANTMKSAKMDNACPHPIYTYGMEYQGWHRLANTDRPILRETGGTGAKA